MSQFLVKKNIQEPVEIENEVNIDQAITKDVDLMWFYARKELV